MKHTLSDYLKMASRLLSVIGLLIAYSINAEASDIISPAETEDLPTVLVLGDSLSASYGLKAPELGWVNLLEQAIAQKLNVVNASISGETSAGGLTRLPKLLAQYKPAFVIIELGGNDGLRGYSLGTIRQQLSGLISLAKAEGAQVLLMEIQIPPNYGKRYTEKFTGLYTSLAQEYQITLIPFFLKQIALQDGMMQVDGIHPTEAAQPLMKQAVLDALSPLLIKAAQDN